MTKRRGKEVTDPALLRRLNRLVYRLYGGTTFKKDWRKRAWNAYDEMKANDSIR